MRFWNALAFTSGPHEAIALAVASEEAGFDGVTVPEHLFYPQTFDSRYPYSADGRPAFDEDSSWPDPWVTIGAMAARTASIRFTTNVYVAPLRDVFSVAKAVSTAAVISDGRVALGVGAGWMREEFEQTGQDFDTRGRRLDEMIPALRALWTGDWAEFHGEHYDFPPVRISPVPHEPIPVWVGGHSRAALRRAAALGDGWIGVSYAPDEALRIAHELRALRASSPRSGEPFEILAAVEARLDRDTCGRLEEAGVTGLMCAPAMFVREPGTAAKAEAVKRFADKVLAPLR